jgi:benzodiazapine receptor
MTSIFPAQAIKLAASVVLCMLAGFIGSIFTTPKIGGWYAGIIKPSFNPPNWLFGPVWTALYVMMAIALYLVWRKGLAAKGVKVALAVFLIQLALNTLWSYAFFGAQSPLAGLGTSRALHPLGQLRVDPQRVDLFAQSLGLLDRRISWTLSPDPRWS